MWSQQTRLVVPVVTISFVMATTEVVETRNKL